MGCFSDTHFFMTDTKINTPLLSLLKKKTFASAIFGKISYVACAINRIGQLIYLRAALHKRNVLLRSLHLKARFNKTIILFVMGAIEHQTS